MRKLLCADLARLWKSKALWIGTAVMFVWAVIVLVMARPVSADGNYRLESYAFQYGPIIGGLSAVFCALFIGTDINDGTIRNKLVVGHARQAVFLSNALVCLLAALLMTAAWLLPMLTLGVALFGWFAGGTALLAGYLWITIWMEIAYTAISAAISICCRSKTTALVAAFAVFFLLLLLASTINNLLNEPQMSSQVVMTTNGMDITDPVPNPAYVSGTLRDTLTFVLDFLPTGQGILLLMAQAERILLMPLYSLVVAAAAVAVGLICFQKKDIR